MQSQLSGGYLNTSKVRQLLYCFLNVSDRTSAAKRVIAYIFVEIRRIHSQNSTKTPPFFTERHIAFIVTKSPFIPFNFEYGTYNSMIYSFYVIYLTGTWFCNRPIPMRFFIDTDSPIYSVSLCIIKTFRSCFWIVCLKVWEWKTSVSTASSKEDSGAIWLKKREENEDFSPQRTFQTIQNSFLFKLTNNNRSFGFILIFP